MDNIRVGRPDATDEEIFAASRQARAHDFIASLPAGYETPVGEKGNQLSEGQKQRIAIARAFLKDAGIVILDEPTSALDVESKEAVTASLRLLMRDRIVLVITHQPSMLPSDTRVLELQNKRVIERDQLPQASGLASVG
jgi:subfamily B ATP-binding cassette protein MsbA